MGQDVLVLRNEFRNLCANPTLRDHGSKRTARLEGCEEVSIPLKRAMVPGGRSPRPEAEPSQLLQVSSLNGEHASRCFQ